MVLNKTMLGKLVSVSASGYYDYADKIVHIVLAIATSTGTVLLPHIANRFITGDIEGVKKTFNKSFDFVSFISFPLVFGLASISTKLSILFLGEQFRIVGKLMIIECVAALFIAWSVAIGNQYLIPTKQNKTYTISVSLGAIVNIILNIPLILTLGTTGAMIATVFSEISIAVSMLFLIRKQLIISSLFTNVPKYLFSCIVMFVVVYILNANLPTTWPSIIIEVSLGGVIYVFMIIVTRPTLINEGVRFFKKNKIF